MDGQGEIVLKVPLSNTPTYCLVAIFKVESKELELELEQPKENFYPVFIKELGKHVHGTGKIEISVTEKKSNLIKLKVCDKDLRKQI